MTPLLGFAPDMEAPTVGVITDCTNFVPYLTGMEAAPLPATPAGVPVLAAECRGAAVATRLDGTRRVIAGTTTKLYELAGGVWLDRSRAAPYTGGGDTRWSFTQLGDAIIAANRADTIQRSTSGVFADIASAPKAEIVFSVGAFVMALNTNDGTEKPNGWHCCASFDDTSWTPSIATQATRGQLVATPGALTAGLRLGEYAVAYKNRSIYLGQYVGAPNVWDWLLVPGGEAGCVGKEALTDIGGAHFFVGPDNFWIFDGTRPQPVGVDQVRQWFYDNSNPSFLYRTKCVFDRQQNRVWVFYPSLNSEVCNAALVYHVQRKQWGRSDFTVEAAINYIGSGLTIDTLNTVAATIDTLPNVSFDSQYWLAGGASLSFFSTAHQLQSLTGAANTSSFTTGDGGDDDTVTLLKQIRLRYAAARAPTSATATAFRKQTSGGSYTQVKTGTLNDGKFDVLQSARWHRARFDFVGPVRVTGINPTLTKAGMR